LLFVIHVVPIYSAPPYSYLSADQDAIGIDDMDALNASV
jgi:hypothetical protein